MIHWKRVDSSAIVSVAYDKGLYVNLSSGHIYKYDVSKKVYMDLIKADSVGRFYNINLRGKHNEERVLL